MFAVGLCAVAFAGPAIARTPGHALARRSPHPAAALQPRAAAAKRTLLDAIATFDAVRAPRANRPRQHACQAAGVLA